MGSIRWAQHHRIDSPHPSPHRAVLTLVNWEISVGNLIEISVVVFGGLWTLFSLHSKMDSGLTNVGKDIKRLEGRAAAMEGNIEDLKKAMVQLAVQDERMNNLDSRILNLRQDVRLMQQGHGFILPLPGDIGTGPK